MGTAVRQKIRLLQSYEVLWIHVIDAICTSNVFVLFEQKGEKYTEMTSLHTI